MKLTFRGKDQEGRNSYLLFQDLDAPMRKVYIGFDI